ncbi:MAG: hypothetical protein K2J58_05870, partial [Muribaculaceae bacterium]|nr:hypothetical protein [Muribaculaceae bacterium]
HRHLCINDTTRPRSPDNGSERRFTNDRPRRFNDNGYNRSEPRPISDKGPRLTNYTEHRAPGKMRSRKNFKDSFNQDDDE